MIFEENRRGPSPLICLSFFAFFVFWGLPQCHAQDTIIPSLSDETPVGSLLAVPETSADQTQTSGVVTTVVTQTGSPVSTGLSSTSATPLPRTTASLYIPGTSNPLSSGVSADTSSQAEPQQESATTGALSANDAAKPETIAPAATPSPAASPSNPSASPTALPAATAQPTASVAPSTIVSAGVLVDGLQYDIPMPWGHEEFESLRAYYLTSGGKKWLQSVMERALPYISYVEKKVDELGLPQELIYLPVIESGYSPFAVSRSGATGIWQFMRNSISGYDMSISDWLDDRKDFMKSTDAALLKLKENYKALGDWPLAIAAYNAGLGAVSRAVKASGSDSADFWTLYESKKLAREPLSYVPKFLAVSSILRYPGLHGLPAEWGEKHDWTTIETTRQVDLSILAEKAGIPLDVLKSGNAELRYSITPPVDSHTVKVPANKVETVKTILKDTSASLMNYHIYKVKSGDTLGKIANKYDTPLNLIVKANPGLDVDKIRVGQTLMIPCLSGPGDSGSGEATSSGGAAASPTTVSATASQATLAVSSASAGSNGTTTSSSAIKASYTVYTVKRGDTLSEIAQRFSTSTSALAKYNGISVSSVLAIGQKLKVPAKQ